MSTAQKIINKDIDDDEIEIKLSDILKFLKDSVRTVLIFLVVFTLLGILYASTKRNEFTTSIRVLPEVASSVGGGSLSGLKSLAGLAGVNLDNASTIETIRPDLYPDVLQSLPFSLYLLSQPVKSSENEREQTLQSYLLSQRTGVLSRLFNKERDEVDASKITNKNNTITTNRLDSNLQLTSIQEELSKEINRQVSATIDRKSAIMTITSTMPDPIVATTVVNKTLNYLTAYVTEYRTSKARQQVDFLNEQVNNARKRYQTAEFALSNYKDQNRSLYLNTAKIEEQRLQAEYLLTQSVYDNLSKQLEQARIKVQEEIPVFQVLDPALIPLRKSGPNRTAICFGFAVLGAILGLIVFSIRRFLKR